MATPRTITAVYASRTLITRPIPLDVRTDTEAVLDLASAALEDRVTSSDSVYQLGAAVLELESDLRLAREDAATSRAQLVIAQGLADTRERLLQEERAKVTELAAMLAHETAYSLKLQIKNAELSKQLAEANAPAVVVVAELGAAECRAEEAALIRAEFSELERRQVKAERESRVLDAYNQSALEMFDVSDTVVVDLSPDRTPTKKVAPMSMAELVGWLP